MKLRWFTDSYVAKTRASQPPRYLIAFAAGSFGVLENEGGGPSLSTVFRRKERKGRKEMENQRLLTPIIFPEKPLLLV